MAFARIPTRQRETLGPASNIEHGCSGPGQSTHLVVLHVQHAISPRTTRERTREWCAVDIQDVLETRLDVHVGSHRDCPRRFLLNTASLQEIKEEGAHSGFGAYEVAWQYYQICPSLRIRSTNEGLTCSATAATTPIRRLAVARREPLVVKKAISCVSTCFPPTGSGPGPS